MAYVNILINVGSQEGIAQLNDRLNADAGNPGKLAAQLEKLLGLINNGYYAGGSIQVTTRDTDPSVATHGTSSKQTTYNLA